MCARAPPLCLRACDNLRVRMCAKRHMVSWAHILLPSSPETVIINSLLK